MARKKSGRVKNSRRKKFRRRSNDVSAKTLMVMIILVFVFSLLSIGMYVYAFYSNSAKIPKSQSGSPVITEEKPAAAGMATIQIIKPPKDSEN